MRRDELDLRAALWSLPPSRTKNNAAHAVPLSPLAIEIIQEAIADAPEQPIRISNGKRFVAPRRGGGPNNLPCARRLEGSPRSFGIAPWSAHDLRRTALTNMAKLGIAPIVLGHVANHLTTTKAGITFAIYVQHQYDKEKRAALNLWADRLVAIVGDAPAAAVLPLARA